MLAGVEQRAAVCTAVFAHAAAVAPQDILIDMCLFVGQRGDESLLRRGASGVKMLWQHNPSEPIGVWQGLGEDGRGLFVQGRLDLAVGRAREVQALMRSRAVDGLSIGFRTERSRRDQKSGLRRLERLDLWEVSVVTFPMQPQARISAVKQAACLPSPRDEGVILIEAIRRASAAFLQPVR